MFLSDLQAHLIHRISYLDSNGQWPFTSKSQSRCGKCGGFAASVLCRTKNRVHVASTTRLPHQPTRLPFISHHCWRVGWNPIGQKHNPNTAGGKKYQKQEKLKDYTIWPYLAARLYVSLFACMHLRVNQWVYDLANVHSQALWSCPFMPVFHLQMWHCSCSFLYHWRCFYIRPKTALKKNKTTMQSSAKTNVQHHFRAFNTRCSFSFQWREGWEIFQKFFNITVKYNSTVLCSNRWDWIMDYLTVSDY